jgi:hypothetical protein
MRASLNGPQAMSNEDDAPTGVEFVVLVELVEYADKESAQARLLSVVRHACGSEPLWIDCGIYRLVSHVRHEDVAGVDRPKPRLDLMPTRVDG